MHGIETIMEDTEFCIIEKDEITLSSTSNLSFTEIEICQDSPLFRLQDILKAKVSDSINEERESKII